MGVQTWKDKIADGSNLWLSASRIEDDGDFLQASVMYLSDAAGCLKRGLVARAALSCSSAADCLEKVGNVNEARYLYFEAAKMYEESADSVFSESIREALWLLQEAHDYYILGGDSEKAGEVYDRCISLLRRVSPFATSDLVDQILRVRRGTAVRLFRTSTGAPKTSDVSRAIEAFLRLRETKAVRNGPAEGGTGKTDLVRWGPSYEKSIVS